MTKYFEGDKIGPYNTLFLKRLPKSRGIFECSFCGTPFNSKISHIVDGGTRSCGCQHYSYTYKEKDKIGPYKMLFKKRLPCVKKSKTEYYYSGIFECPHCGKDFVAEISAVSSGSIHSCGCL